MGHVFCPHFSLSEVISKPEQFFKSIHTENFIFSHLTSFWEDFHESTKSEKFHGMYFDMIFHFPLIKSHRQLARDLRDTKIIIFWNIFSFPKWFSASRSSKKFSGMYLNLIFYFPKFKLHHHHLTKKRKRKAL